MRKITFVLIVMLCAGLATITNAQVQFSLGLKGGVNFASIDVNDVAATWDGRTGFHGGAFALFKITAFAIQPELIFSQQGSTVKFNTQDLDANFTYLNVPVIAKFYLPLGFNLQAGPQFGFLTSAKSDYNPITNTPQDGTDLKEYYKNSDLSIALGLGWDVPKLGLTIDGRYNLGVSEIQDNAALEQTKNQVWQVSLGYKILKIGK